MIDRSVSFFPDWFVRLRQRHRTCAAMGPRLDGGEYERVRILQGRGTFGERRQRADWCCVLLLLRETLSPFTPDHSNEVSQWKWVCANDNHAATEYFQLLSYASVAAVFAAPTKRLLGMALSF